jgi:hypothetical protein
MSIGIKDRLQLGRRDSGIFTDWHSALVAKLLNDFP